MPDYKQHVIALERELESARADAAALRRLVSELADDLDRTRVEVAGARDEATELRRRWGLMESQVDSIQNTMGAIADAIGEYSAAARDIAFSLEASATQAADEAAQCRKQRSLDGAQRAELLRALADVSGAQAELAAELQRARGEGSQRLELLWHQERALRTQIEAAARRLELAAGQAGVRAGAEFAALAGAVADLAARHGEGAGRVAEAVEDATPAVEMIANALEAVNTAAADVAANLQEALAEARRAERGLDERRAAGINAGGLALLATARYDDAADSFRRAAAIVSHRPEPRFNLAAALLMAGDACAAAKEASALLDQFETDPRVRSLAGFVELAAANPGRAAELLPAEEAAGSQAVAAALALLLAGRPQEARVRFAALADKNAALERLGFVFHQPAEYGDD